MKRTQEVRVSRISLTAALGLYPHSSLLLPSYVSRAERTTADTSFLGGRSIVTVMDAFPPITGKTTVCPFLFFFFFLSKNIAQCQIISNI